LQLLLNIGALDSEETQFWLKENLEAVRTGPKPVEPGLDPGGRAVPTPDRFFDN
jgi:hypothetical protein